MLYALILSSLALADVVGPDPTDCPAGSDGTSNHNGPYCMPTTCDGTCSGEGATCKSAGLCILEEERYCGGMTNPDEDPCTYTHREAMGTCDDQSDCTGETTCEIVDRCIEPAASFCGCNASSGAPALMVLLGLLPLAVRRSRSTA